MLKRGFLMQASYPITDEVVLIGGGHAHALVLKKWAMKPVPGVRLTVINPAPTAPYTGMLPGYVAGHYAREALEIDLVQLARHAGARLILGAATGIDRVSRHVSVSGRADVFYDLVSVDIGITSEMLEIPGFGDHAHAAKPLGPFAAAWADYLRAPMGDIVVIGGGVAGVELALAMAHSVRQLDAAINLTVIEQSDHLLDGIGSSARKALLRHLTRLQVKAMTGVSVTKVAVDHVELSDGRAINTRFVTGAAGARRSTGFRGGRLCRSGLFPAPQGRGFCGAPSAGVAAQYWRQFAGKKAARISTAKGLSQTDFNRRAGGCR
jgi:selenide, water dikinase